MGGGRSGGGPRSGCRRSGWRRRCSAPVRQALGGQRDPGQRGAQVALDVVGQRLERRDVQDADGAGRLRGSASGSGGWRAGRGSTGRRPGSCHSPSARGSACARRSRWPPSRAPGRRSAPRSWPGTSHERLARRARADRRSGRLRPSGRTVYRAGAISTRCSVTATGRQSAVRTRNIRAIRRRRHGGRSDHDGPSRPWCDLWPMR